MSLAFLRRLGTGLVLFAAGSVLAQGACPPPAPQLQSLRADDLRRDVRDRGLLWRLDKDGRTSWLYGTVHASRVEWAVPGPRIQAALLGSDVLALELDPRDPELVRMFSTRGDPAREQRVLSGLGERIAALGARACVPVDRLAAARPMLQLATLSLAEARRDGFHPEFGVDVVLAGMAMRLDKELVPLETPAAQLAAMLPASEADERALIESGVADLESGEGQAQLHRLLRAWADADEADLAGYPQWCKCLETPAEQRLFQRVNDQRNGPMADRIAALHGGGKRVFAAVGALHMTGAQALPALLRARGFQVQRIPFPTEAAR